jgi:outer membrane murein-binding lipoprotein Lpp
MIGGLMKSRKIMIIVASIAVLLSIGGCTVKHKDDTKQGKTIATSSTKDLKEDKEAIKKKQLNYLKEHEQEMTTYVKEHNANIHQVSYDWDSIKTVVGGNGTPQGGDEILLVYGYANESKLTNFSLNFTLDKNKIPKIDSIGSDSLYRIQ